MSDGWIFATICIAFIFMDNIVANICNTYKYGKTIDNTDKQKED